MQFVSGGVSFAAFTALVRWGLKLEWPFAVIVGLVWALAVGSLVVAARDPRLAGKRMSGYTHFAIILVNAVAGLGVTGLDALTPELRLALGFLVIGTGACGVALGMLGAVTLKPRI